jgi:hypothetical protein
MLYEWNPFMLTRRRVFKLASGAGIAGWTRLYAASPDFWNKKEPSQWSSEEIKQLTTQSPWAKDITAQFSAADGSPYGGGYPPGAGGPNNGAGNAGGGVPSVGIPGIGGGGMGGGRQRGGPVEVAHGIVRWESSKVILDALKTPIPDAFAEHYVISVTGVPLDPTARRRGQDNDAPHTTNELLEGLKSVTALEPKNGRGAQPGVVQMGGRSGYASILFGFSKDLLNLKPDDREVNFSTQFGHAPLRAKFVLKEMMYHGELAL